MISTIKHLIRRAREEGLKNSLYLFYLRIKLPLKKQYNRYRVKKTPVLKGLDKYFNPGRTAPKFFFDPGHKEKIVSVLREEYPGEVEETLRIAKLICARQFGWLIPGGPDFGEIIDWHSHFPNSKSWPRDFYQDLDYSGPGRPGDVRLTWELNRHQYFVCLGKAYWLTGSSKYAEEWLSQILDWIKNNRYGYGINWLHSQEAALRVLSWTWAFHFFSHYPGFTPEHKKTLLKSIYQHAVYISTHLSERPPTHNHLLTEVCALACLGILFPEFKQAGHWQKKGIKIFQRELLKQVWPNGAAGELASSYHAFILDSALQLTVLMKKNNIVAAPGIDDRIEAMIEYTRNLCKPDGSIPLLGDNDSGRACRLSEYAVRDRRAYAAIGAVLYERSDLKKSAGRFYEEAFWLLGEEGIKRFRKMPETEPVNLSHVYESAGIAIFKDSPDQTATYIVFRGGPTKLRKGVSFAHNHADSLSFELYSGQTTLLKDPGTYLYSGDEKWRTRYRETAAHSTIVIDKQDQVNIEERFSLPHMPLSKIHAQALETEYDYIDMSHSGYSPLGIIHRRKFLFVKKGYIIIIDDITGEGNHTVEQYFHCDRNEVFTDKKTKICTIQGKILVPFGVWGSSRFEVDIRPGWASHQYGEQHQSKVIRITTAGELPIRLGTLLVLNSKKSILIKNISRDTLEITGNDFHHRIEFKEKGINFRS
ncbi:MAG: hypothetical protein GY754_07485 [bacterium]|nr:hypothetical protein [bacterium]